MKNIDKIRQMNSEELIEVLSSCKYCIYNEGECNGCFDGIKQWLEQEVEE